jgi:hypothetical protein
MIQTSVFMDNKRIDTVSAFVKEIQQTALIVGIILSSILSFVFTNSIGYGFLIGVAISIINFRLMAATTYHLLRKGHSQKRLIIIIHTLLRFSIIVVLVTLIATRTNFHLLATVGGILIIHLRLIFKQILDNIQINNKILHF